MSKNKFGKSVDVANAYATYRYEHPIDKNKYFESMIKTKSFHLLTTKSKTSYTTRAFKKDDYIVFGSETKGIDENFLNLHWKDTCTIPMENKNIRSLNLATSVGIVLYEALRQNNDS